MTEFSSSNFPIKKSQRLETLLLDNISYNIKRGLNDSFLYNVGLIRGVALIDPNSSLLKKKKLELLPFFYPNGTREFHKKDSPFKYNGFLHIDLDFKESIASYGLDVLKEKLSTDKFIKLMFISPSNRGLKILVQTGNKDLEKYSLYLKAFHYFLNKKYQIDFEYMDSLSPQHICFYSYDRNVFYNRHSDVFSIKEEIAKEKVKSVPTKYLSGYKLNY